MAERPTDRVTLLFTDIEGSTHLLHDLGEPYTEVLAEHNASCARRSQTAPSPRGRRSTTRSKVRR